MKALFLIPFFILFVSISQAQDNTTIIDPINNKKGDISLYVSPFAMLDYNPTICLGVEYFLKDNISIHTDLGYLPRMQDLNRGKSKEGNQTVSSFINARSVSFIIKPEIRFYESNKETHSRYTGLRFLFKNANYDIENQNQYYTSRRISTGLTFLRGWQSSFRNKMLLNYYVGLGFRLAFNTPSKDVKEEVPFLNLAPATALSKKETFPLLDIALGLRFGGKIKRN